jgi:cytochrome P450
LSLTAAPPAPTAELPPFIRRTLGLRSPRRIRYDALVRVRIGEPVYLLTHPEDVRHVLVVNPANYVKTRRLTGEAGRRRAGTGLLTSTGPDHLRRRHLLRPAFRRDAVAPLAPCVTEAADAMLARWGAGGRFDLRAETEALAKSIILRVLFGRDLDATRQAALERAIATRRRYTELVYHGRLPARERLPLRTVRAHGRALSLIDHEIHGAIARRRGAPQDADGLILDLMTAVGADGSTMSDDQVRDEVLTLMSTGYETLGEALAWTWYLLDRHPEADAALAAEVADALGARAPVAADVPRLRFLDQVISETLRLYPPTWLYARVPLAADSLPVGGPVPAEATLYICQYLLHRHPRLFPEPERFDPARFRAGTRPPRFAYIPFGDGRHRCLGEHLARLEAALVVARVAQRVRVTLEDRRPAQPSAGITLRPPPGLWARAEPRSSRGGRP